jgi:transposase
LLEVRAQRRDGLTLLPQPPKRRQSVLDRFEQDIHGLLQEYPDLTGVRLHEKLRARGFEGGYTIIKDYLRRVRPRPTVELVERFETQPGKQGQMDYSPYVMPFTKTGPRKVHAFSYLLGYSRRQHLRFLETDNFTATVREHIRAFEHLKGVAATCLYDSFKSVVDRWLDGQPVYNRRFLAFATHYGFRPVACRRRRPQTKGKVERPFDYVEKNLFNGRTFRDLDHLNEVATWWLSEVADKRVHRETGERPIDRFERERPFLLPLPGKPYDTAEVTYRSVDAEGYVPLKHNQYSVPGRRVGQQLIVRMTEDEVIVYDPNVAEIARHRRLIGVTGQKSTLPGHGPGEDRRRRAAQLRQRFQDLGDIAERFLEGLIQHHRYGWEQAARSLSLLALYEQCDFLAALQRAVRYRAFSAGAVERILAMQATPRTIHPGEEDLRAQLADLLEGEPIGPRSGEDYELSNQSDDAEGKDADNEEE